MNRFHLNLDRENGVDLVIENVEHVRDHDLATVIVEKRIQKNVLDHIQKIVIDEAQVDEKRKSLDIKALKIIQFVVIHFHGVIFIDINISVNLAIALVYLSTIL